MSGKTIFVVCIQALFVQVRYNFFFGFHRLVLININEIKISNIREARG